MAKSYKEDYGNYILNNKEQLLKRKRKIIMIKRMGFILLLLLIVLVTLGFTLPEFNLAEISVKGNNIISQETILTSATIEPEVNIFKVNTSKIEKILLKNSYIESVEVKRKLPNKILISIKEKTIAYSVQGSDGAYTIDKNGRVLGIMETVSIPHVLPLEGVPIDNLEVGELIQGKDGGNLSGAQVIYDFLNEKGGFEQYPSIKLEITNFVDYKLYIDKMYIKLGASDNMNEKLSKAFSILNTPQFLGMTGYIDVSFKGNPVVYKED